MVHAGTEQTASSALGGSVRRCLLMMAVPTLLLTLATLLCASAAPAREVLFASYPSESIDTCMKLKNKCTVPVEDYA